MNGIGKLSWVNIKSGLIYGVLWAILAMGIYTVEVGDVFALNIKNLINAGAFGFLGIVVSLLKNILTTNDGKFAGAVKVK